MKKIILIPAFLFSLCASAQTRGLYKCSNCDGATYSIKLIDSSHATIKYDDEYGKMYIIKCKYKIESGIMYTDASIDLGIADQNTLVILNKSGGVYVLNKKVKS